MQKVLKMRFELRSNDSRGRLSLHAVWWVLRRSVVIF